MDYTGGKGETDMDQILHKNERLHQAISHAVGSSFRTRIEYTDGTAITGYLTYSRDWAVLIKDQVFDEYGHILTLEGIQRIVCDPGTLVLYISPELQRQYQIKALDELIESKEQLAQMGRLPGARTYLRKLKQQRRELDE